LDGPNYKGEAAELDVSYNGEYVTHLHAEKRFYTVQRSVMTEAAVHARLSRDLYVALGESLSDDSWALSLYVKPFVRWIWLGGLLMALGGLIALCDKRYRRRTASIELKETADA
jgi:cytochrome c-type biogenesis protein CcmF